MSDFSRHCLSLWKVGWGQFLIFFNFFLFLLVNFCNYLLRALLSFANLLYPNKFCIAEQQKELDNREQIIVKLKQTVSDLKEEIEKLKGEVEEKQRDIAALMDDVRNLQGQVRNTRFFY